MGSVDAIAVPGLELWFNSNDHLPHHFHAEKAGEWEVRVYFLRERADMFETKWTARPGRPSRGDLKALAKLVDEHRAELLTEWQRKVSVRTLGGA